MRPLLDSFIERAKEIRILRQHLEEAKEIQKRMEMFDSVDKKTKSYHFRCFLLIPFWLFALNLKEFNTGDRAKMEDNTSKQEPKVRWTELLKPTFKTKANKAKTRWTILLK